MTETTKTCANCRLVGTNRRPRAVDATGFGDQIEFGDDDETVYTCRAPVGVSEFSGREIGVTPITCSGWSEARTSDKAKFDEMEARFAARTKDKR